MKYKLLLLLFFLSPFVAIAQGKGDCDVITLKNGSLIYCKVIAVKKGKIVYKDCRDNSGKQEQIPRDSATMINHPDGSYEMLHGHSSFGSESTKEGSAAFVAIEGGIGIPIGNYSSAPSSYYSALVNYSAGFATLGAAADAYTTIFFNETRHFGMSLLVGYGYNGFDFNSYFNSLAAFYSFQGQSITLNNYESSFYHNYRIMTGITLSPSIGAKLNLDFSFLIGACVDAYSGTIYSYNVTSPYQAFTYTQNLNGGSLTILGGEMRAGARFNVSNKICLLLNGCFLYTLAGGGSFSYTYGYLGQYQISLINVTAGVAYDLGK